MRAFARSWLLRGTGALLAVVEPACSEETALQSTFRADAAVEAGAELPDRHSEAEARRFPDGKAVARDGPRPEGSPDATASDGHEASDDACSRGSGTEGGAGRPAAGLRFYEIAALQAVKIPVMSGLVETTSRKAEVVAGRPALLRAYVAPLPDFVPRPIRARLTLVQTDPGGIERERTFWDDTKTISAESSDAELGSTFNFNLESSMVQEGTRYSIELLEGDPCRISDAAPLGTRFPENGTSELHGRPIGKLRVLLVPVLFKLRGQTFTPDTSAVQIERFRRTVTKLFPISGVEIAVRTQPIETASNDMQDVLDQITALRDQENTDRLLSYYGLVKFTEQRAEYCNPSCVLGAGVVGESPSRGAGSAVGVGYGDDSSAVTFAHELGHVYGRPHTPCNVVGDPGYPYRAGSIGSWGYDILEPAMIDPARYTDLMGYCAPVWISDYVYGHLQSFMIEAGIPPPTDGGVDAGPDGADADYDATAPVLPMEAPRMFRTLLLGPGDSQRWGRSRRVRGEPSGRPELADVLDRDGRVVEKVRVYRSHTADVGRSYVYVPEPPSASWWSLRMRGETPQRFGAATSSQDHQ